jgi:hypothetical protein
VANSVGGWPHRLVLQPVAVHDLLQHLEGILAPPDQAAAAEHTVSG